MRNQHGFGPLHMGVTGHHRLAGCASLLDQRAGPCGQSIHSQADLLAHIETEIGRNLLVAAAAGVQLEPQRADALGQLQFDKVMNVLGRRIVAYQGLARLGCVLFADHIQRRAQLRPFTFSENPGGDQRGGVRLAGGDLTIEKPPVKDNRALPGFKLRIQRLAESAGPHHYGLLLVRHAISSPLRCSAGAFRCLCRG